MGAIGLGLDEVVARGCFAFAATLLMTGICSFCTSTAGLESWGVAGWEGWAGSMDSRDCRFAVDRGSTVCGICTPRPRSQLARYRLAKSSNVILINCFIKKNIPAERCFATKTFHHLDFRILQAFPVWNACLCIGRGSGRPWEERPRRGSCQRVSQPVRCHGLKPRMLVGPS